MQTRLRIADVVCSLKCKRARFTCNYAEKSSDTTVVDSTAEDPTFWTKEIASVIDVWLDTGVIPSSLEPMPEVSWLVPDTSRRQDARVVYHGTTVVSELGKSDGHLLALGLELFSVYVYDCLMRPGNPNS